MRRCNWTLFIPESGLLNHTEVTLAQVSPETLSSLSHAAIEPARTHTHTHCTHTRVFKGNILCVLMFPPRCEGTRCVNRPFPSSSFPAEKQTPTILDSPANKKFNLITISHFFFSFFFLFFPDPQAWKTSVDRAKLGQGPNICLFRCRSSCGF